jgi:hypothetical protein
MKTLREMFKPGVEYSASHVFSILAVATLAETLEADHLRTPADFYDWFSSLAVEAKIEENAGRLTYGNQQISPEMTPKIEPLPVPEKLRRSPRTFGGEKK